MIHINQNGTEKVEIIESYFNEWIHSPGLEAAPKTYTIIHFMERDNPHVLLLNEVSNREARNRAGGVGFDKKQMPLCNEEDRGTPQPEKVLTCQRYFMTKTEAN